MNKKILVRKNATLIEMVIVVTIIIAIFIFSINSLSTFKHDNPPLILNAGYNLKQITFICDFGGDGGTCEESSKVEYCDLNFKNSYFDELDDRGTIEGKLDLKKYVGSGSDKKCQTKKFVGYRLKSLRESVYQNLGSYSIYLINGLFYDENMNKISGVYDPGSSTRIFNGVMYFS